MSDASAMNARAAGRRGGKRKSPEKKAAARKNGARGGRPKKMDVFVRCMREMHEKLKGKNLKSDPGDIDLVVERLCRPQNSGRRFFLYPRKGGGYDF